MNIVLLCLAQCGPGGCPPNPTFYAAQTTETVCGPAGCYTLPQGASQFAGPNGSVWYTDPKVPGQYYCVNPVAGVYVGQTGKWYDYNRDTKQFNPASDKPSVPLPSVALAWDQHRRPSYGDKPTGVDGEKVRPNIVQISGKDVPLVQALNAIENSKGNTAGIPDDSRKYRIAFIATKYNETGYSVPEEVKEWAEVSYYTGSDWQVEHFHLPKPGWVVQDCDGKTVATGVTNDEFERWLKRRKNPLAPDDTGPLAWLVPAWMWQVLAVVFWLFVLLVTAVIIRLGLPLLKWLFSPQVVVKPDTRRDNKGRYKRAGPR